MSTKTSVSFTPKDVMSLRQKTGMGMMDCKAALEKAGGDMAKATDILRAEAKGKMDSRTERATGEGRVAIVIEGSKAAIIEVRCESDFAAKNPLFSSVVDDLAKMAMRQPAGPISPNAEMSKRLDDARLVIKEHMAIARGERLDGGSFGSYVHHDHKRAALVQIEGQADAALLKGVCQHIVAHVPPPVAVSDKDVSAAQIEQIRAAAIAEAKQAGKPEQIAAKMADGRVRKFLEENTLLNQKYIQDDTKAIKDLLPVGVTIKRFARYTVGAD